VSGVMSCALQILRYHECSGKGDGCRSRFDFQLRENAA
jgi:hypothetical protein